jgi:hypothetical protein
MGVLQQYPLPLWEGIKGRGQNKTKGGFAELNKKREFIQPCHANQNPIKNKKRQLGEGET